MNSDIEPRDNLEITLISIDGVINTILTNFFYFWYMSYFKRCLILLKAYLISLTSLSQQCPHPIINVELTTGIWASEIFWVVLDETGSQVAGPFYGYDNNTSYSLELCLEPACYTVWMEDSYGDGWQGGSISFFDETGDLLASGAVNASEYSLNLFTSDDCLTDLCDEGLTLYSVTITQDLYGEELVWGILNEDGGGILGPFSGYQSNTFYEEFICLADGCYSVWMQDTYGDGWQGAELTVQDMDGNVIASGSVPESSSEEVIPLPIIEGCPFPGCTNPEAMNYDESANIDDDSCIRQSDNVQLYSNWNDASLPTNGFGGAFSDVEGLKVGDREYAVIASTMGAHIIDISSETPVEVQFLPGSSGGNYITHRDYHIDGNLLFAVCDQGTSTLQIFDLGNLPESVTTLYDSDEYCITAHNVFVDNDSDLLYICSTDGPTNSTTIRVLDVSNPESPSEFLDLGPWIPNCHDIYVENDTAWINSGPYGYFVMHIDENPTMLGNLDDYPVQGGNHSGWWIPEKDIYVFADETHGSPLKVVDTSDLTDMQVLSTLSSGTDSNCIPHNLMIRDDLVFVSYYHDGLQVFDISNPEEPNLVAWFDTHNQESYSGYQGAWGVHSALPSGKILISDIKNGLFVLNVEPELNEFCPWYFPELEDGYEVDLVFDEVWESDIVWVLSSENMSVCPACPGDLDNNGSLGVSDLTLMLSEFGCTTNCSTDLNNDGSTTIGDLLFWLSLFGTVC